MILGDKEYLTRSRDGLIADGKFRVLSQTPLPWRAGTLSFDS